MVMSLSANMPRYFIQHLLGASGLGIFSAAAYLTMTGSVIISAIAESSIARMAQCLALNELDQARIILRRVRDTTLVLSSGMIVLRLSFGRALLAHLYRAEYAGNATLLTVMMCAAGAANLASVYGYGLIAARRFQTYLFCLAAAGVVTTVACASAIPRWGTMGAAAACLAGYAVQVIASRTLLQSSLNLPGRLLPAAATLSGAATAANS